MSFRFFDPRHGAVVDLLGRQPPLRRARSAGLRLVRGRPRHLRGRRHARRPADPSCASRGRARTTRDAALGAGVLGRRRRRPGRRTGSWTSRARRTGDERPRGGRRGQARLRHVVQGRSIPAPPVEAGGGLLKWYDIAEGDRPVPPRSERSRARPARGRRGRRAGGRARVRHPAPLRRELLLPADRELAQRERALGDGLGQGGRGRAAFAPWPAEGSTGRRSASGSWARCATSRPHGAATCARRATRSRARSTSRTPTRVWREPAVSVSLDDLRRLALALPEATEQDHHGKPSFRVGGKIFATLRAPRRST